MANFVEVASVEQLPSGSGRVVRIDGKEVAIFNVDGTIYATADSCLHQGLSLGTSKLDGKVVTCRGHGWKYDVTTGSMLASPEMGVAVYA
ncbi:MAG: Rieske 2Fe-2S domain-containing protein, partial [Candidatus Acidiferrales bacterium]